MVTTNISHDVAATLSAGWFDNDVIYGYGGRDEIPGVKVMITCTARAITTVSMATRMMTGFTVGPMTALFGGYGDDALYGGDDDDISRSTMARHTRRRRRR